MAEFPDPSPFEPDAPTDEPTLSVPLPPPLVGEGNPWAPADAENRDRILDWWRMWWRRVFFPWVAAWTAWWLLQWLRLADYLNTWIHNVDEYITAHAIPGYGWWKTSTPIAASGTTVVTITANVDEFHYLQVGDFVSDSTNDIRYGVILDVIDLTHAVVQPLGVLRGLNGYGWYVTDTDIAPTGTTNVVLAADVTRSPQIGDLVSDRSIALRYGRVTAVIDDTHVTVTPLGVLRGLPGFGWWRTSTTIAHAGTTDVVLASGPNRPPQLDDIVLDDSESSAYGTITAIADDTHVTVTFVNTLQGPPGVAAPGEYDFTTPELAIYGDPGDVYQGQMAGVPQMLFAFTLVLDKRAWVRIYASEAYMLADAARDIMTPLNISADHGCYLDFVGIPIELSKTLTPGVQMADLGLGLWISITNTDNDPQVIAVHSDYRIIME